MKVHPEQCIDDISVYRRLRSLTVIATVAGFAAIMPVLAQARGSYPNGGELLRDQQVELWAERGEGAFAAGNYSLAIKAYSKLALLKPHDARVFFNRGLARRKEHDDRGALEDFNEALSLNPKYPTALINRAILYISWNRFEDACTDLNDAERLRPRDPAIPFIRGTLYARSGKFNLAITEYSRALEINLNQPTFLSARGVAYLRLGQTGLAKKDFERALSLDPNDVLARRGLGVLTSDAHSQPTPKKATR